jgi:hypothetical protein
MSNRMHIPYKNYKGRFAILFCELANSGETFDVGGSILRIEIG